MMITGGRVIQDSTELAAEYRSGYHNTRAAIGTRITLS